MTYEQSIKDWQIHFKNLYGKKNKWRSPEYIWSRLLEEYSEVLRDERKGNPYEVISSLLDIIAWIFGFSEKIGMDLEDALIKVYPSSVISCPVFRKINKPCPTVTDEMIKQLGPEDLAKLLDKKLTPKITETLERRGIEGLLIYRSEDVPSSLSDWQNFFYELYGETNMQMPESVVISRIGEEAGKVARDLRLKQIHSGEAVKHIVQTFAWTIGAINRVLRLTKNSSFELDTLLWRKYKKCPKCKREVCSCPPVPPYYVFISAHKDLQEETEIVYNEIKKEDKFHPITYKEIFKEKEIKEERELLDQALINSYIREKCDILICILHANFSPWVQSEVLAALDSGKKVFAFKKSDEGFSQYQKDFINKLLNHHVFLRSFNNASQLKSELADLLEQIKKEWIKK